MGLGKEQRELDQRIPYVLTPKAYAALLTFSSSCDTIESVRIDLRQSDGANHRIDEVKHEHSNRTQEQPP